MWRVRKERPRHQGGTPMNYSKPKVIEPVRSLLASSNSWACLLDDGVALCGPATFGLRPHSFTLGERQRKANQLSPLPRFCARLRLLSTVMHEIKWVVA